MSGDPKHGEVLPEIFSTVVKGGFCIGCGACAAFDSRIDMQLDEYGKYVATALPDSTKELVDISAKVCPFADGLPNEDELAKEVFGGEKDNQIGHYIENFAGYVAEADYRKSGSSGGMATWLAVEILRSGLADAVVHVGRANNGDPAEVIFGYAVSRSEEEVRVRAKTRYYPVEMSGVIPEILAKPARYVIVGVPCFIKAIRLASLQSDILRERVTFTIGIVCGHLKSSAFAEMLAWQCEVEPEELTGIDFRTKLKEVPASHYGVTVESKKDGHVSQVVKPVPSMFGTNWGWGFFKYKACDYCDDVVAETADVSVGDAWLPEYSSDSQGTSIVIVRSSRLHSIIRNGIAENRLVLSTVSAERVAASQDAGLRHRRHGLSYRLWLEDKAGRWRPTKRVKAADGHINDRQKKIFETRIAMAEESHVAFLAAKKSGGFPEFVRRMTPLTTAYSNLYIPPLRVRVLRKLKNCLNRLISRS